MGYIMDIFAGWWLVEPTPLKNMSSSIGMIILNRWKNKHCSELPTRMNFRISGRNPDDQTMIWIWLKIIHTLNRWFPTKYHHSCGLFGILILSHCHLSNSSSFTNCQQHPTTRLTASPGSSPIEASSMARRKTQDQEQL